ncbi:transporter substrate-binding domain-containing protein [Maricurvus nonylphenolicus]
MSSVSVANEVKFITVNWPPFYASDLPHNGFVAEIAREALRRKGYKMDLSFTPLKRAKHLTRRGEVHALFGCWNSLENRTHYNMSKAPLANGSGHFLAAKGSDFQGVRPEELLGKRVGIVRGYTTSKQMQGLFESGKVTRVEVSRIKQLLDLMQVGGRIDLILENVFVAKHVFQQHYPDKTFGLEVVGEDYIDGGLYICWAESNPEAHKMRVDFDEAIQSMINDGSIDRIESRFGISLTSIQ